MRFRPRALLPIGLAAALWGPPPARAQIPYYVFDDATQVRSIDFVFPEGRTFPDVRLLEHMVLAAPGWLSRLHGALAFLPLVSDPAPHPFTPLDLQRDVARVRRFYAESGFIGSDVRYEVAFDEDDDRVEIDMIVTEGRPIRVRSLEITTPEGDDPATLLSEELASEWRDFEALHQEPIGRRFTEAMRARLVGDVLNWWMNRGWAFARARAQTRVDSTAAALDLDVRVDPGPRSRVGSIRTEGNRGVADDVIVRALPFRVGDWFSAERLAAAQRRLFSLDLFRLVLVDVPADQPRDSTVGVRVRLEETPPRLFTGELGYVSAGGGLTGHAEWAHRNFMGGARTLSTTATFQTGLLSLTGKPEREYGLTVSFRRPFTFHPRLTLNVAPYGRYRDNLVDRSWEVGNETTLIHELGPYRFLTFQHGYSSRRVLDYRLGSANALDLATLLRLIGEGALDSLATRIDRSTLSVSATIGRFDPTSSAQALQARPTLEVTAPAALNTIEFTRVELPVLGYMPLRNGFALAAQARLGRVYPFGKTLANDDDGESLLRAAQLRDVLLTAGGTGSVRGWGNGLLGPKFPNLVFSGLGTGDAPSAVTDGYIPAAGLARATASIELRTPFPGLSDRWGLHAFLDAGRVWTPDARFRGEDPYGEQGWFYGAGAGVDVATLVGPVRLSVGYKLNPSPLDVRSADDVFEAISEGRPISSVKTDQSRRFHIHVALGQIF
jgi:outer membrane protein insertion porin family